MSGRLGVARGEPSVADGDAAGVGLEDGDDEGGNGDDGLAGEGGPGEGLDTGGVDEG